AGQLARGRVPHGGTLLGLYEGRPLTRRSVFEPYAMPDRITIFQGPHERLARGPEHLAKLVEDTVWHEGAHYFGLNEREVRAAERGRRWGGPAVATEMRNEPILVGRALMTYLSFSNIRRFLGNCMRG